MKLLLDECLPIDLRLLIQGHDVFTVAFMGWKGIKNGQLLALAGNNGFDALITTDSSIERQQNLSTLPVAVVILHAPSNDIDDLKPLLPALHNVLASLSARTIAHVR
jgi:hypothetical protein